MFFLLSINELLSDLSLEELQLVQDLVMCVAQKVSTMCLILHKLLLTLTCQEASTKQPLLS